MQHLPLFTPVVVREAVGSVVAHNLGQKESSKGNIHDDAFVNGLGQHLPHKLEQQQMIVLSKRGRHNNHYSTRSKELHILREAPVAKPVIFFPKKFQKN